MPSAPHALLERTWWIEREQVLGGPYPGDLDPATARARLDALLDLGVRTFVSLMEPHERGKGGVAFVPYAPVVADLARARGVDIELERFAIVDLNVPTVLRMREIQSFLDERRAGGRLCYVHCWGGRGRTGTVAGVYLIRRGLATPENFAGEIAKLRAAIPIDVRGDAPETAKQRAFVRSYPYEASNRP
jgi:hypothetical protein